MDAMVTRIANSGLTWIEHTLLLALRDFPAYVHRASEPEFAAFLLFSRGGDA
jgi:hypothetical protein